MANGNKKKQEKYFAKKKEEDMQAIFTSGKQRSDEIMERMKTGETVTLNFFDLMLAGPHLLKKGIEEISTPQTPGNPPAKI
jgi:uncharacterized coiled-coil DUF342 family protein